MVDDRTTDPEKVKACGRHIQGWVRSRLGPCVGSSGLTLLTTMVPFPGTCKTKRRDTQ